MTEPTTPERVWLLIEHEGGYEGRDNVVKVFGHAPTTEDIEDALPNLPGERVWLVLTHGDRRWDTSWDVEEWEVTP